MKISQEEMLSNRKRNVQALLGMLKIRNGYIEYDSSKTRLQKTDFQKAVLKDIYKITRFPSKQNREDLALLLSHSARGLQIWFQNQRNKAGIFEDEKKGSSKNARQTLDIFDIMKVIEQHMPANRKRYWDDLINYAPIDKDSTEFNL